MVGSGLLKAICAGVVSPSRSAALIAFSMQHGQNGKGVACKTTREAAITSTRTFCRPCTTREQLLCQLENGNWWWLSRGYFRLFGMFSAEWEVLPPFSFGHASPFYTSQCAENFHGWKNSWHPGEPRKWQKLAPYKNNLLYNSNESLQQIQCDYTYFPVALLFALMTSNCGVKFCKLYDVHASSYIERLFPKIETNADTT